MTIAGLSFDHMHMGDLLRQVHQGAADHCATIIGVADPNPQNDALVTRAAQNFAIAPERVFRDYEECLAKTRPDIAIVCSAIAAHAELTELCAAYGAHVLVEKPFAISLEDADRMIAATQKAGVRLAINWPLAWAPPYVTAHRLISQGTIGEVLEVHSYGGNSGPVRHGADKIQNSEDEVRRLKNESWFYNRAAGGGSLLDYLGYGVTMGTWFHGGRAPLEVTAAWDVPEGLEVDEHSITIARYPSGLSKFETRWGTFTDPWTTQPQPQCGFTIVGSAGTLAICDYKTTIRLQTLENRAGYEVPVDELQAPNRNPIEHFCHAIEHNTPLIGPLDPQISRTGQRIIDAARQSATEKRTVTLPV